MFSAALQNVEEVLSEFGGAANPTYDEFNRTLNEFRCGKMSSSTAFSTLQTLFQNDPNLLDALNTFKPTNCSAAVAERSITDSVDFINRVKLRFGCGRVYSMFLDYMQCYSRRVMSASEVCDKVIGLLGENDDLVEEFMTFVPESTKRRIDDQNQTDFDGESRTGPDEEIFE